MPPTRHVLLMLSTDQPPDPIQELQWHSDRCVQAGQTAVATTHLLGGMRRGESIVAFYGSASLDNRLLGQGVFEGFARTDEPRGKEWLSASELYAGPNRPDGIQGMIQLTAVQVASQDEGLEALEGTIEATGAPLALANLPDGPSRARVYFTRRR